MKKIFRFIMTAMLAIAGMTAKADEGMWLPSVSSQRIVDMQDK